MSEWISVEDRLPAESMTVIVYANDIVSSCVDVAECYVCPEYGNSTFEEMVTAENYAPTVTHWQPLPLPPTPDSGV